LVWATTWLSSGKQLCRLGQWGPFGNISPCDFLSYLT